MALRPCPVAPDNVAVKEDTGAGMTVGAAGPWAGPRTASPSSAAVRAVAAWPVTCELMPKLPGGMSGTWLALKLGPGPHDNPPRPCHPHAAGICDPATGFQAKLTV